MTEQAEPLAQALALDAAEPQHDRPAEEDSPVFAQLRRAVKADNLRIAEHGCIGQWL
ncbi:hypothetical protein ACFWWM_00310 [Streptomyces sp. NPDC058682]|uniref:hypothetical protein n=1 Tax=Streptomyces sp. NPDC058682 TaxID=3346596 RepID=UPI0036571E23